MLKIKLLFLFIALQVPTLGHAQRIEFIPVGISDHDQHLRCAALGIAFVNLGGDRDSYNLIIRNIDRSKRINQLGAQSVAEALLKKYFNQAYLSLVAATIVRDDIEEFHITNGEHAAGLYVSQVLSSEYYVQELKGQVETLSRKNFMFFMLDFVERGIDRCRDRAERVLHLSTYFPSAPNPDYAREFYTHSGMQMSQAESVRRFRAGETPLFSLEGINKGSSDSEATNSWGAFFKACVESDVSRQLRPKDDAERYCSCVTVGADKVFESGMLSHDFPDFVLGGYENADPEMKVEMQGYYIQCSDSYAVQPDATFDSEVQARMKILRSVGGN